MPSNRFDSSIDKSYVSNYLQLPFGELQAMAAGQQKNYDDSINETYKLKDLMTTVPAINDPQLGLSNVAAKQKLDAKYSPKLENLSNRITKGDIGAQRELINLKREWSSDPERIELENSYKNYQAYKEDKIKKAGKYDELLDDYRNQNLYDESGLKPFRYSGMEDKLDIEKRFAESMDKIKEDTKGWDIESLGADGIKIGRKGQQAGITADKVLNLAQTKVSGILTQTPEGQQFVKKLRKLNPNLTNQEILQEGIKQMFASGSQQIFSDISSGNSVDVTSMWGTLRKEGQDEKEANRALIGSPIEGTTMDLTMNNPDFQKAKSDGLFVENNDGTLDINYKELNQSTPKYNSISYDKGSRSVQVGETTSYDKHKQLSKTMRSIAEIIDYKGEIKPDNYKDMLSKYNSYSKVRLADEQMAAPVSQIESQKFITNFNNYEFMDTNSPDRPINEKPTLNKKDKVVLNSWNNSPDGKMNRGGYIIKYNSDGEVEEQIPILVRPKSIIDDKYHNTISELGLKGAKYETGNIKPIRKEGSIDIIDQTSIPQVGKVETFGYYDNTAKKKSSGYLLTPEDGSQPINFPTYAGLQQYLNSKYYGTDIGNSERYNIAPKKASFEDTEQ